MRGIGQDKMAVPMVPFCLWSFSGSLPKVGPSFLSVPGERLSLSMEEKELMNIFMPRY